MTVPEACPYDSPSSTKPTSKNTLLPADPAPSSQGAAKLNRPINTAIEPSRLRRPMRSASQPDSMIAPAARKAPTICTLSTSVMDCSEYMTIHDSGNTVAR